MKKITGIMLILLAATMICAQNVGDDAADFQLTDPQGTEYTLSQFSGRVVLLFTLGNTCTSCIAAGPEVQALAEAFQEQAFTALGLDFWDASSTVTTVGNFAAMTGIQFPILLKAGSLSSLYETTYDRLIVVDQQGRIAFKGSRLAANDLEAARTVIQELLSETGIAGASGLPEEMTLDQNFPNPFNPSTFIRYYLPEAGRVRLEVFDLLGHSVAVLVNTGQNAGTHRVLFNADNLPGGAYFYRLYTGGRVLTRKMVLMQ